MALSSDVQDVIDKLNALKDRYVEQLINFQGRYNDVAANLSDPTAVETLTGLQDEYAAFKANATTELDILNKEKSVVLSNITDPDAKNEAKLAVNEVINSINDNVIAQLKEVRLGIESSLVEAKKLAEEAKSPENNNPSNANTNKEPTGPFASDNLVSKGAGTTVAGKAGNSKADNMPTVGLRDYNPLSEFSSYTYRLALYMMNTKQFNEYMRGDYSTLKDFELVAQSGGITAGLDSPRADGFELDLYLDDLEIVTLVNTKETQSATNSINFKFKVYEPYGFSFPHKLTQAMIALQKKNFAATNPSKELDQIASLNECFLMVVKFYGYDKNGKLVTSSNYPQPGVIKTDSQSVFERGFPIKFKDFKFKLENKLTVYNISAVQYAEQIAKGVNLGTVPAKISISGETVEDVLMGKSQDGSKKSISGLAEILNKMEIEEANKKNSASTIPNEYKIEFEENTGINDALLVPKDYYVKEKTPMATVEGGSGSNEKTAWKNRLGTVEKKTRTMEIPAGQPIVQTIDNIIGQSEYIKKMMVAVDEEIDARVSETSRETDVNAKPATMAWYNINTIVERKGWDEARGDYAHKITYKIGKYEIPYYRSLYSSNSMQYYGPHKRYYYWYTGQNKEILSYEQDYNFLYTVEGSLASEAETKNLQSAKTRLKAGQNADSTTSKSGKNDIVNSIKSFLYSTGDLVNFKLKILGDPDYLMPAIGTGDSGGENRWYGSDFSINPNSGQVFFEIDFQQGEDYDHKNGLLNPNGDIKFAYYPDDMKIKPKGIVYMLTQVTSHFHRGKFEQTLKGVIPEFVNAGAPGAQRDGTPPENANPRENNNSSGSTKTEPVTQPSSASQNQSSAAPGPKAIPNNQTAQTNPTTKVAEDVPYTAPVGTYANAGREPAVRSPLQQPKGKSIMFNNGN